jgi:hypothetical protein
MLLEEHVAPDRGNHRQSSFEGFRDFWPGIVPSYVPDVADGPAVLEASAHQEAMAASSRSTSDANKIVAKWAKAANAAKAATSAASPLLVVVGPGFSTPHAVAFLITRTADGTSE